MPRASATTTRPWVRRDLDPDLVARLGKRLDLCEPVAALLAGRGWSDPDATRRHLAASPMGLHDPGLLPDMAAACDRLTAAAEAGETVLVHGDYDVDGVTGTAILMRLFDLVGLRAAWHIPNRMTDGYSFGEHSLAKCREVGATLVISVDNGTSAFDTIAALKAAGVDTIVTDHHEPPPADPVHGALPDAVAIVNPKRADSAYPWRELCGGAVAFKLAWAFARRLEGGDAGRVSGRLKAFLEDALSYVAIATLCDVVPLEDENRIFARAGLTSLCHSTNPGLAALARVAGLEGKPRLGAQDVTFSIGPRINASGRLGSAQRAVELLLAKDDTEAARLADELDELNEERKRIEAGVLELAREAAAPFADREAHPVLVVAGQGWHQGVVGIVAARLVEEFDRPAIVIGLDGAEGRGSARSVPGFDVLAAMHGAADHLSRYGGHAAAAGCEVAADAVDLARTAIEDRARELIAARGGLDAPPLVVDTELPLSVLSENVMHQVDRLEPFGAGNDEPLFLARGARLDGPPRRVGADGAHLVLELRHGARVFKGIGFRMGDREDELRPGVPVHLAYRPMWNTFRGRTSLELRLVDFRVGDLDELPPA